MADRSYKIQCECGKAISKRNLSTHRKSAFHEHFVRSAKMCTLQVTQEKIVNIEKNINNKSFSESAFDELKQADPKLYAILNAFNKFIQRQSPDSRLLIKQFICF
jgi:hypothetical protein